MMEWFYERNTELLESPLNLTFEEILWYNDSQFRDWCRDFRKLVVKLWDKKGLPPRVGYNKAEIIDQFNNLNSVDRTRLDSLLVVDEMTGTKDVIRNTTNLGNAVNQWFPTMMKTRINYSKADDGKSIYDYFAKDELFETFVTYARRHFKRDSFYHYSTPAEYDERFKGQLSGLAWVTAFEQNYGHKREQTPIDYWLNSVKEDKKYTGYNEEIKARKFLTITRKEIESLGNLIPEKCKTNIDWKKSEVCQIRLFKLGQKLFPVGLKAFRVSFCQYAVNFPPLTARYLYERYTNEIEGVDPINIYDPSAGWGGRLLGAMSVSDNRNIHYIGTDPNRDHDTSPGRTKYHELADFFCENTTRGNSLFPQTQTYQIFQDGSEVIHENVEFQKYKGKIDLVFTSPPYFAKEIYSNDAGQSATKFPVYDKWRDGFLKPTLKTCVEWLKPGGYLIWNIADAKFGKDMLPLEKDSKDILESLGMKFVEKLKMALAQMPGSNRMVETGETEEKIISNLYGDEKIIKNKVKGMMKNYCRVSGIWLKYEPIFIFQKP